MSQQPDCIQAEVSAGDDLNRREALLRLAGAGLCACCAGLAAGCPAREDAVGSGRAASPPRTPDPAGEQRVTGYTHVDYGHPKVFKVGEVPVWIARHNDARGQEFLMVFDGRCPHARCKIEYFSKESAFRCPCHGSRFSNVGERLSGPARRDLRRLWYRRDGEDIYVDLSRELEQS